MGQIRNLQRYDWLIPYLFGASPAVCKSFFVGKATNLPSFDETTYYAPHATSLRMGDIGYQNSREEGLGVKACYDNVDCYADSLLRATMTPAPERISLLLATSRGRQQTPLKRLLAASSQSRVSPGRKARRKCSTEGWKPPSTC